MLFVGLTLTVTYDVNYSKQLPIICYIPQASAKEVPDDEIGSG